MADKLQVLSGLVISYGLKILGALAIFIIGKWLSRKLAKLSDSILKKSKVDETLRVFLSKVIYVLLLILVIIVALGTLGFQTTSFVAVIGAATLAVGLALQSNLSNFGAGVMILLLRPFKLGDVVEAGGTTGIVEDIGIFHLKLKTFDNRVVIVPNSNVIGSNIVNYSEKEIRRVDLVIGVGYEDDLKKVKEELWSILKEDERILDDPAPTVAVSELADSSVNFVVRPWVRAEDYWGVYFDLLEKIKTRFDEKGISIPYPQMDIHLKKQEA